MPFSVEQLAIPEVLVIAPRVLSDGRGFFMETYKQSEFAAMGIRETFVQENHSSSARGVLRGLHFQRAPRRKASWSGCSAVRSSTWRSICGPAYRPPGAGSGSSSLPTIAS